MPRKGNSSSSSAKKSGPQSGTAATKTTAATSTQGDFTFAIFMCLIIIFVVVQANLAERAGGEMNIFQMRNLWPKQPVSSVLHQKVRVSKERVNFYLKVF